jgi:hypothetical protein
VLIPKTVQEHLISKGLVEAAEMTTLVMNHPDVQHFLENTVGVLDPVDKEFANLVMIAITGAVMIGFDLGMKFKAATKKSDG